MNQSSGRGSLRVAYYSNGWPPGHIPSGIATYVSNLRRGLQAVGVESTVLASTIAADQDEEGIVRVLGLDDLPLLSRLWEHAYLRLRPEDHVRQTMGRSVARAVAGLRGRVDLVEVEESFGFAEVLQRRVDVPTVIRLHGPWFLVGEAARENNDPESDRRVRDEGQAIRNAVAVSAPSELVLRQVCERYGVTLTNSVVIPNPGPDVKDGETWNQAHCEPESILFIGRFDTLKGGDVLIDAFARLARKRPHARLLFVGPDKGLAPKDGEVRGLTRYVADGIDDPGVRSRIHAMGLQPPSVIAGLRRKSAVTVVSSLYETLPMTVIEAMAFGCPLVATRAGGIPELTSGDKAARLVAPGDSAGLAAAIVDLLEDPAAAARLGAEARQHYLQHMAPVAVARRMASFYESVVSRWQSGRTH